MNIAEDLTALEIDALQEIRENWKPAQDYFAGILAYLGIDNAVAEEVALLVLNADRVAVAETRRAFTYFGLFGFPVDGIFVNKVLPSDLANGHLNRWVALQQHLLDSIQQSFLDVTKFRAPLLSRELIGLEPLAEMARSIFGEKRPDDMLSEPKSVSLDRMDGKDRLTFWLPNMEKHDLDVGRKDRELILTADSYTRVFSLPGTLIDREIAGAKFTDGTLTVLFD